MQTSIKKNSFVMKTYVQSKLITPIIFLLSLTALLLPSCTHKTGKDMSDADFIKITVRFESQIPFECKKKPWDFIEFTKEQLERLANICEKYGYDANDYQKKKKEILNDWSKQWIQINIKLLMGQLIFKHVKSDDEWE